MSGVERIISSVGRWSGITNSVVAELCNDICNQEEENRFGGVFPSDQITAASFTRKPFFNIIVNLAEIGKKEVNGHFVSIIGTPDACLYIDPFGLPNSSLKINKFLTLCNRPTYYNTKTIQDLMSPYCGMYAILFCVFFNKDSRRLRLQFQNNPCEENDQLCVQYIRQLIREIHM